jgi:solute carrier family 12 sodium/potassium/chloride transporter 2
MSGLSLKWFLRELNESRPSGDAYEYGSGSTLAGVGGSSRPSMSNLRRRQPAQDAQTNHDASDGADDGEGHSQKTLFGMWDGVFVRCLLNIFGVIMFLRLGWMVSFGGVFVTMLIVVLSSSITFTTALSLSAICTNGKIAGGGAYYLISRALGPEFGGSIGVLLYLA